MTPTFTCLTFGCRVNQYETQAMREVLLKRGFRESVGPESADLVVINSCTVTDAADRECVSTIRALHRRNPQGRIAVVGCFVQRDAAVLKGLPGVRLLVGNGEKHRVAEWAAQMLKDKREDSWRLSPRIETQLSSVYAPLTISGFSGRSRAFVKVQDGCDRSCAFCKIPYVRGRSRSRPLGAVLEEIQRLVEAGFQEIVLTGVAIGLWGREGWAPQRLADLVAAADRLPGRFRLRLSSLDPRDLEDPLIEALEGSSRMCHHLHLSLQSGSDPILRRMNRGYTVGQFLSRVERLRRVWPDLGLTTDLIVGFPGETEAQFQESVAVCRALSFAKVHVFPYSPRRGTTALAFQDPVPPHVVRERARCLRSSAAEAGRDFSRRFVGTVQQVLAEKRTRGGRYVGYTGPFVRVCFQGPAGLVGRLSPVRIQRVGSQGLEGFFYTGTLDKMTPDQPSLTVGQRVEEGPLTSPARSGVPFPKGYSRRREANHR